MIWDGYTEWSSIDGDDFAFRPLTRFDRVCVSGVLGNIPEVVGERLERQVVASRIVYSTFEIDELDDEHFDQIRRLTFGIGRTEQEIEDEKNLYAGVRLAVEWPRFKLFTCEQCRVFHLDPKTGTAIKQDVNDTLRKREPHEKPDCEWGTCPRGHWRSPVALSEKNSLAYRHYKAFREALPGDSIVLKNARIIRNAELSGTAARNARLALGDPHSGRGAADPFAAFTRARIRSGHGIITGSPDS